ncbi:hypothetical protein [Photobacterium frigidiphilum]|uniref:hypothetical protein n=1 Tax=Photobacterium frigidiphilum TaxID=264736 RepID=UPI0011B23D37|nr:hypothetical protein [Photobacterium frigidiphilum]
MLNPTGRVFTTIGRVSPHHLSMTTYKPLSVVRQQNEYTHDVTLTINESCDSASYHYLCGTGIKAAT